MNTNSYLDFAENDYSFFMEWIDAGMVYNALPAIAQDAAEKYLKDIIDRFFEPHDEKEYFVKKDILKTHSLKKLFRFIEKEFAIEISDEEKDYIEAEDIYYINTIYPGDDSFEVDVRDMRKASAALKAVRSLHLSLEKTLAEQI